MYQKIKEIGKTIGHKTTKEVCKFLAPLTAISSMAGSGGDGILDNITAVYHVPETIGRIGHGVITDAGMRTVGLDVMGDLSDIVQNGAINLAERPVETIGTAAGVYAGTRFLPELTKYVAKPAVKGGKKLIDKIKSYVSSRRRS